MASFQNLPLGAILLALCLVCLFFLMRTAPHRLFNSFLLVFTLLLTVWEIFLLSPDGTLPIIILFLLSFLLLLAPLMLIWNGVMMIRRESGNLANILSLLLGIVIAAGEISFAVFLSGGAGVANGKLSVLFAFLGLSVLYGSLLVLAFVLYMLLLPWVRRRGKYDVILIHGCALIHGDCVSRILAARLDVAIRLFHESGERAFLIVSGGQGDDETITEAEAMRQYLLAHEIPPEKILPEDRSRSTEENLRLSKELMEQAGLSGRIALVTSNYHIYRCLLTAKELEIKAHGFGSRVAAYYWPSAVIREFAAIYSRKRYLVGAILGYWFFVLLPVLLLLFTTV